MRRVPPLTVVASLALLAGLAGGAGARPAAIAPPALGKAHDALDTAYAEEELALFTLSDLASAAGRAEAPGALKRSQAALGDAAASLKSGGVSNAASGDVADAQDDDVGALASIAAGKTGAARQKIASALEAKDGAMLRIEAQLMSSFPSIGEYLIPVKDAGPTSIVSWGGRLWFTESNKGMLESLDPFAKGVHETQSVGAAAPGFRGFKIPGHSRPQTLAEGPDGALWFTDTWANAIGRLSPDGKLREFKLAAASQPYGITAGPDGALWFTEEGFNKIGRITTTGKVTEFQLKTAPAAPQQIVVGPDHALWFTEYVGNKIGRITTKGVIREFQLPKKSGPAGIAAGKDGALWFTEYAANKIGRITTAGKITQLKLPYDNEGPDGIVALPNGTLAYVTYNDSSVGVIANGKISETEIQNGGRNPNALTVGPGGQIFVTEYTANKIGRVAVG
ncbi:MAG TPA: hypothetical protein VMS63_06165 [Gaiellaceae bacterium]|nr:hypothetical protein [Gaiellaceae bacterium]